MNRLAGWVLTIVGIGFGVYGLFVFALGVYAAADSGPDAAQGRILMGIITFGMGVLAVWVGRQVKRDSPR